MAEQATPQNDTPLHHIKDPAEIRRLVAAGADVNGTNSMGVTPLHTLTVAGAESLRAMVQHGGMAKSEENAQRVAEAIKLLIELGADINKADGGGQTPLHYAVQAQNSQAIKFCLRRERTEPKRMKREMSQKHIFRAEECFLKRQ
jgi:ankyrin repeat protein